MVSCGNVLYTSIHHDVTVIIYVLPGGRAEVFSDGPISKQTLPSHLTRAERSTKQSNWF